MHKELSSLRMKNSNRKYCGTDVPVSVIPGAMSQMAGAVAAAESGPRGRTFIAVRPNAIST